jgi:hypothetical protein
MPAEVARAAAGVLGRSHPCDPQWWCKAPLRISRPHPLPRWRASRGWRARCGPPVDALALHSCLTQVTCLAPPKVNIDPPTASPSDEVIDHRLSSRARAAAGPANLGAHSLQGSGHRAVAPSTRFERKAQLSPGPR